MKNRVIFYPVLIGAILWFSGCAGDDTELRTDTRAIADIMCRSLEAMKNLKTVDPADSVKVKSLQLDYNNIQGEMTIIYKDFRTKYGEKTNSTKFNKVFRKYLNESMLDCKSLSKEDRENFEREIKD